MTLPAYSPVVFVAESGKKFALLAAILNNGDVAYSPDGETFYALAITGVGGSYSLDNTDETLSFENPHDGTSGKLRHLRVSAEDYESVTYEDELYTRQDVEFDSSKLVPLPLIRRVEYLCQAEDGMFVYVSSNKYNDFYDTWKLFVGDGNTMRHIPVDNVDRYRDGGTTIVETMEQNFFSPSPRKVEYDPTLVPQWGDQKLVALDPKDYDVVETTDNQVTISKK